VTGSSATYLGVLLGQFQTAGAFTPAGNYYLTQIDVALSFGGYAGMPDADTNGFTLSLNQDSGGVPGAAIETWTGLTAPDPVIGTSSVVETVLPVSTVTLLAGVQYWIVASPAASNSLDSWAQNAYDGTGPGGIFAVNPGSGFVVHNVGSDDLAFDVLGSPVPEPGTLLLIPSALIGLGLIRKRRRA